jgi:hypothetical protein
MAARQTVVLQSWVQIQYLPSPQLTANLVVGRHLDGTWLRADLCERQQRRKLQKMNCWFAKNIKRKKKKKLSGFSHWGRALPQFPVHAVQ